MFKHINKPAVAAILILGTGVAMAGTTGTEFQSTYNLVLGWAQGYLGKAMAIAAFLFGGRLRRCQADHPPGGPGHRLRARLRSRPRHHLGHVDRDDLISFG